MAAKLADVFPPGTDVWLSMSAHMLDHIAFLSIGPRTVRAFVRSNPLMHPDMVENAPSPSELFVAAFIFTSVDGSHASSFIFTFLYGTVIVLEELDIFFTLFNIRFLLFMDA